MNTDEKLKELSYKLVLARQRLYMLGMLNTYNRSVEDLVSMQIEYNFAERELRSIEDQLESV